MKALSLTPQLTPQAALRHSFTKQDLELCSDGHLFGVGNAQLPAAPLLLLDRITDIQTTGGEYEKGYAIAELDIAPDDWFFKHHFRGDAVMPGCMLLESLWQLTGFHLAWSGYYGKGRVLDSGKTRFLESVSDTPQTLKISIHVRKILTRGNPLCIANGEIMSNDALICRSNSIKMGLV